MTTSGSNLQGTLDTLLTFHVREVEVELQLLLVEFTARIDDCWLVGRGTVEEMNDIHQRLHAIYFQLVDNGSFSDILLRHDEALKLLLAGTDGNGQCSTDRLQMTVQSQLAHQHIFVQSLLFHLTISSKNTDCQGQVVARTFFLDIGRRQIDGDVHLGHLKTVVGQGCFDAVIALLNGCVGQSRQVKLYTARHANLTGHCVDI